MTTPEIIAFLGGTNAAARFFGVKPPSASGWLESGAGIPDGRLLEKAAELESLKDSPFSRRDQWPSKWQKIWPELANADASEAGQSEVDAAATAAV